MFLSCWTHYINFFALCRHLTQVRHQNAVVLGSEDSVAVAADVQAPDLAVDLLHAVLDKVGLESHELRSNSQRFQS